MHLLINLVITVKSSLGKLVGGVVSGANAVALHSFNNNDPYFDNGRETYWPAMGQNFNGMGMYWLKANGDVYRQWGSDEWYPTQGISIYDSWLSQDRFPKFVATILIL